MQNVSTNQYLTTTPVGYDNKLSLQHRFGSIILCDLVVGLPLSIERTIILVTVDHSSSAAHFWILPMYASFSL